MKNKNLSALLKEIHLFCQLIRHLQRADRQFIAKLRFEEHERTLKQLRKQSMN